MSMLATNSTTMDQNDVPLSTLIEQNKDNVDVNFISRSNFDNNAYRGNFNNNPRPNPGNPSNNYGNSYNNNRMHTELENSIKEFISSPKNLNTMVEEKLSKFDDMSRNMDRLVHDVHILRIKILPPNKDEMTESLKAIQVSIVYNRKMIDMLRARREREVELRFLANHDEDVKTISVSTIENIT